MNEVTNKSVSWSIYWAQDRLHSCVASNSSEDQKIFEGLWQDFAESIEHGGKVLDLATGNGAVPFALLSVRPDLHIDAVDKAQIDPMQFLSHTDSLKDVKFHPETDVSDLPFDPESFAALTSQFGIEYAGLNQAIKSVLPYLQSGGSFQFIVHSVGSDIMQSSKLKIEELERLLKTDGLLDVLLKVMRSEAEFSVLEAAGASYLEGDHVRTQALSGQVFSAINLISEKMVDDPNAAINLAVTLDLRVRAEYSRLQEMSEAAQSKKAMQETVAELVRSKVTVTTLEPIYIDEAKQDYLLGWLLVGKKP